MTSKTTTFDALDQKFRQDIYPKNWVNPPPKEVYDLVVIGGGPGGMTAATVAAGLNASVAIVEKEHFGGECLSYGCIPSKAFLRSSRCAAEVRDAAQFGIEVPQGWSVNFPAVMQRVRRSQTEISPQDSPEHFRTLGIDVFFGSASFADPHKIQIGNGPLLHFKKAIIATGTLPIIPEVPGLSVAGYLTNQTVFSLRTLPARLAVLGAGPIGCELSQAFLRFGSQVSLITRGEHLLPRDDLEASVRLRQIFEREGVQIYTQTQVRRIEVRGKEKILHLDSGTELVVDAILVSTGRLPAVAELNLEKAGVKYDLKSGVLSDETLRSTNPDVYVAGDAGSPHKFTHISIELAKIAVHNALAGATLKRSSMIVPWATYTDPEIAHVGLQEKDLQQTDTITHLIEMKNVPRALLDSASTGFVKIHVQKSTGRILGATLMAQHAGEMISELTTAMLNEKGISALAETIHPFPTQAEAIGSAALALKDFLTVRGVRGVA